MKMSIETALKTLMAENIKKQDKRELKKAYRTIGMHLANATKGHKQMSKEEWHEIAATETWNIEKLHLKAKCWENQEEQKNLEFIKRWADTY